MTTDEMYGLVQRILNTEIYECCEEESECKFFKPRSIVKNGEATYFIDAVQKAVGAKDLVSLSEILNKAKENARDNPKI